MKTASKKLVVSIVVLLLAVCLTTATTFAWFALNNTPSVENFDLTVTTGEGLQVSATEAGTYAYTLAAPTTTGIKLAANTVAGTWATDTWTNTVDATTFALATVKQNAGADTVANSFADAAADSYLKFDIWFKAVGTKTFNVQLSNTASSLTQTAAGAAITATREYTEADQKTGATTIASGATLPAADITNAVRVAFVPATGNAIIWNVNGNKAGSFDEWTVNPAHANYDDKTEPNLTASQKVAGTNGVYSGADIAGVNLLTAVDNTTAQKLTIYVWAEGKDADCFDAVLQSTFSTVLSFIGMVA